jgi:uroporphyrinogen III methyltransferase/synthase
MSAKRTSEPTSLTGRRILVTRAADQASSFKDALAERGAVPIVIPTIAIVPPPSFAELDRAIAGLDYIDYLLLTSANAVDAFFDRLNGLGLDVHALANLQTVAVGPKSAAALAERGVPVDLVPEDYRAEGVVALLRDRVSGKRLLYPRAALARDLIPKGLRAAGAEVIAPVAYTSTVPDDAADGLQLALQEGLDLLTFTASSTVRNLVNLLDSRSLAKARLVPAASIGPLTSKTARESGFNVVVEPPSSTLDDMIEAIQTYFARASDKI